ncbi:MAG: hypothetical protein LBE75_04410 [Burkholderiales bacterium]|jgi:hypothetical protein|nr:hypothetical protein [Burkholderiales bacterium]
MPVRFERIAPWLQQRTQAVLERPLLVLFVIWLLFSWPWLSGKLSIPWDSAQEFYPGLAFAVQQLREGSFPWWNPYLFAGYPQFADPQAMTFQPTVVLPLLLSDLPAITWFNTVIVLHVFLAGIGALAVARSYRLSPLAQLLFALTFMYGGVAASRMQHTPMLISYCLLPWLWWGLRRLAERPDWRRALIAGVVGGLCALQLTQVTYLIALLMGCYALWLLYCCPHGERWRCLSALAAAALVSLLLSSPQWLSTFAFLPFTNRAELSLAAAAEGSLRLPTLATLLAGNVLSHTRGTYWGPGDLSQEYLYIGILPLVAWLCWGGDSGKHRGKHRGEHQGERRFWSAVLLLAFLYALGRHTPFYEWLYHVLPGMSLFRRPPDALFLTVPALGLLGAMALDRRLRGQPTRPHKPALVAAGLLLAYTIWMVLAAHRPQALMWLLYSAAIAGALLWLLRHRSRPVAAGVLLAILLLCVLDLRLNNVVTRFNAHKNQDLRLYRSSPMPAEGKLIAQLRTTVGDNPVPERLELYGMALLTNGAGVFGIGSISGYNPMLYNRYARLFGISSYPPDSSEQRVFTDWAPDFSARAFDLLGLRGIVNRSADGLDVTLRPSVLPRILNPTEVRVHEDDLPPPEAFRLTDFSQTLWLPAGEAEKTDCPMTAAGGLSVGSVHCTPNAVTIEVSGEAPGWLVLNEIHMSGWYARVGDEEVPLLRGNGMFRVVCVPAGSHRLTIAFSPLRFLAAGL